jgi:hypothetical protein
MRAKIDRRCTVLSTALSTAAAISRTDWICERSRSDSWAFQCR